MSDGIKSLIWGTSAAIFSNLEYHLYQNFDSIYKEFGKISIPLRGAQDNLNKVFNKWMLDGFPNYLKPDDPFYNGLRDNLQALAQIKPEMGKPLLDEFVANNIWYWDSTLRDHIQAHVNVIPDPYALVVPMVISGLAFSVSTYLCAKNVRSYLENKFSKFNRNRKAYISD